MEYREIPKRKLFISYYNEDQYYRDRFEQLFGDIFINKSVKQGDIDTDISTEYVKRLLQTDYLKDTSVLVVLCGSNTWKRRYVDWEIYSALTEKVGGHSGLAGLLLPSHPTFSENTYNSETTPLRLYDNIKTGYAGIYRWTENIDQIKKNIEESFERKENSSDLIDNSREQFKYNKI